MCLQIDSLYKLNIEEKLPNILILDELESILS
jgi:hypothetical protein